MGLYTSRFPFARLLSALFDLYVRIWVRPRVKGREHIPAKGPFIIASNHNSHADTAVIFASMPRALRKWIVAAAAADYFFKGGFRQTAARALFNTVPIFREQTRRQDPLRHVVRALREGYGVVMYPEGTRSRNGSMGSFRPGIGRLIAEFPDMPVIPTYIHGTTRVLPKGKVVPRPFKVHITFGEPLYLHAHPHHRATWQTAADQVRAAILAMAPPELPPPPSNPGRRQLPPEEPRSQESPDSARRQEPEADGQDAPAEFSVLGSQL